jgi:uncharacterized membrane protein
MTETIEHDPGRTPPTGTAHVLYILHAISPFTLWTLALVALVIGAVARDSVRGTWVETHYSWLARTCIWGLVWLVVGTLLLVLSIRGILLIWLFWGILTIWYLYRVIRGWLRLNDRLPAP